MNKKEDEKIDKYDPIQDKINRDRKKSVQKVSGKSVFKIQEKITKKHNS